MPETIASYVAGSLFAAGTAATTAAAIFVAKYGALIITGIGLGISGSSARRAQRKAAASARAAYEASLVDRTSVIRSPIMPRNIVFGRDRASGMMICWFTWGPAREYHTFAITLAGHECHAVDEYYFNGEPVTLDGDGYVTTAKWCRKTVTVITETLTFDGNGRTTPTYQPVGNANSSTVYVPNGFLDPFSGLYSDGWLSAAIDGNELVLEAAAGITNMVSYSYEAITPLFRIWTYLGAAGQQRSPILLDAAAASGNPSAWDDNRKGTGVCYCVVQMEADFDVLGQIGVPNISAIVRGVKAYDTRTATTAWTQNPAVLARWFLVESIYSPTTLAAEIGVDELEASANVCDEVITLSAGDSQERYQCNGQLTTEAIPMDNLGHILDAMDGDAIWVSGAWQLVAGYYKTPTLSLDEDDLSDAEITVLPATPKDKLVNLISGTFVDASKGYQRTSYPAVTVAAYVTEDNGETLPLQMDLELVNDARRCQMIAWQRLTRARQQLTTQFGTNLRGYDLWPLENVEVRQREFYGASPKVFAVKRREFLGGTINYVMQETGPEVWDWDYTDAAAAVDIPNTSLPDPLTIATPSIVAVESGDNQLQIGQDGSITSRIKVTLAGTTDHYVTNGGFVETRYAPTGTVLWQAGPAPTGAETAFWFSPVEDGVSYTLQARYRNSAGRFSPWSAPWNHTVVGKLEKPPDVEVMTIAGDVLTWTPVDARDLAGYKFVFQYGQNTDYGSAAPLHTGVITESPYKMTTRPSGQVTIMVKAIDTSGNESNQSANIFTDLGDAPIANIVEVIDFEALGWPGSISDGAISGDDIVADSLDSFYGTDSQSFYGEDTAPFYEPSSYAQLIYTTNEVAVGAALAGSVLTLRLLYSGIDLLIEYRLAGPGSFYGADGDSFYGDDADPMYGPASEWAAWPGQLVAVNDVYQFRVTLGAGADQGVIDEMTLTLDAPDIEETVDDLSIDIAGTTIPYTKTFSVIKNVQATLQSGSSGATNVEIDKAVNLAPKIWAVDNGTPVAGATADITIKGY